METLRLRRIQEPSRIERLLEAFVSRTSLLPDNSYQIRDVHELPQILRSVVSQALAERRVWSCWAHGPKIWLFTCEMSLALSRERGAPVILVNVYGEDAALTDSGCWRYDQLGTWSRCAD